ncbi:MAG: tRNA guanosine(34) transglycosylase Tgt [Candidatus Peribacteraceae bacterium]|jgi:queuine tRNA-ribosyltransferase|nr:tRNA guanosine(34) transglycosylase Tgt [Candidatus Peribacteraceae bacterium]|tara:strand:+ start:5490 stop:6554 length:1065 start_codon:yes stop_codon:yes gene_type:complete
MFTLEKTTDLGRRGKIETPHGIIETPFFMPVGTAGAMKGITHTDLIDLGAQILLCNTYHLHIQPGEDIVQSAGGLHSFVGWDKPILTDSGGYQVYSLRCNNKIKDEGVHFNSHLDGAPLFMGPEESITIQHKLGADLIMCFDECPPSKSSKPDIEKAVDRTLRWAKECKEIHKKLNSESKLLGIVQGGLDLSLRKKCAEELVALDFDGYAIGGLAVGESEEDMLGVVEAIAPLLPEDKPRYLMGVGVVSQMKKCIAFGIDMFDCVLPMRIARHGKLLMLDGTDLRITNAKFKNDHTPIDSDSPSKFSRELNKSYLHHLVKANERLGETYAQMQNIGVTLKEMEKLRNDIELVSV